MDEEGLSGDRELLLQILEKDKDFKELLGKEIRIADLVNRTESRWNIPISPG